MYIISKSFEFSASHKLEGLSKNHPCSRQHGHNYVVTFFFKSEKLTKQGFVIDYRELDAIKKYIDNNVDHRHLNDLLDFNPTAELIATYFFTIFKEQYNELFKVMVSETNKTTATYED